MQASNSVLPYCGDMHNMQESVKNICKMPNRMKQMDMFSIYTLFITNMISVYI